MKPIFKHSEDWEQAELLMQPSFIRIVDNLRNFLEESPWQATYEEVETPYPGHQLCLTNQDHSFKIDLWQICFQVCFLNYHPQPLRDKSLEPNREIEVVIDPTLFNDQGEVDWSHLEEKTKRVIEDLFKSLPI